MKYILSDKRYMLMSVCSLLYFYKENILHKLRFLFVGQGVS